MGTPYVGDLVLFVAPWNTFKGQRGRVTATTPHFMVLVDGDRLPMRFDVREVVEVDERSISLTGAE